MQKGDVILVDYTGRDLATGHVFETTQSEKAKKENVFDPRITYKPVPVVLGKNEMLPALESKMEQMKAGETKKIVLTPVQAFGERDASKIRISSLKDFREHKLVPHHGMVVEANGIQGRVQSVSGGRVRIDFNHPLAGKEVEYEVHIQKKIDALQEQVSALFDKFFPFVKENEKKISEKNGAITIELPKSASEVAHIEVLKNVFTKVLSEQLQGVQKVAFVPDTPQKTDDTLSEPKQTKTRVPKAP